MKHKNIKSTFYKTFYAGAMAATMVLLAPEIANAEGGRGPVLPDDPLLPSNEFVYTSATLKDCKALEKGYSRGATRAEKDIKKNGKKLADAKKAGDKKKIRALNKELKKNKQDHKNNQRKGGNQRKECDRIKTKLKSQ